METLFQINPQLDIPIYQQLVDTIRAAVKKGSLVAGQQLPTVQEMSQKLSLARGTIKRAYDELEHQGVLEKIQGRGTFICYQPANSGSRKEQAMAAIDSMFDSLEEMGFSATEINIFLTLKLRERSQDLSTVKVAVVECNPENVSRLSEQLRRIMGIELYSYLLDTIREYPYKLDEDMDLVVTTAEHAPYLESILADRQKLARVALRMSLDTLTRLMKLKAGETVGILCSSSRFGDLVYHSCRTVARHVAYRQPQLLDPELDISSWLGDKDAVLAPVGYEKYCTEKQTKMLAQAEQAGKLIPCSYEMDEGSLLLLEEKLNQIREGKKM